MFGVSEKDCDLGGSEGPVRYPSPVNAGLEILSENLYISPLSTISPSLLSSSRQSYELQFILDGSESTLKIVLGLHDFFLFIYFLFCTEGRDSKCRFERILVCTVPIFIFRR